VWPRLGSGAKRQAFNLVGLAVLIAILSVLTPLFLTSENVINVLKQTATVATVGGFFTITMVAGGVDLSVSGVLVLSGAVSVLLVNAGVPIPIAFAAAVCLGLAVGIVNGLLVSVVRINTVIATLGTLYITTGLAQVWTNGKTIAPNNADYAYLGNGTLGPFPILVVVMLIALVVAMILERRGLIGRYAVLTGSNSAAARLSGIPTRSTLVTLFALTGAAAGWAGVMVSSQLGAADPFADAEFAFEVIIATLLGGTSILGGEGTVVGLLIGALIVSSALTGMNILGVPSFVQTVLTGVVLIAAVGLDAVSRRPRGLSLRRKPTRNA
jgi:ribose/xylose/arabinose/galactoside ABC-type transport system permease subunit